MDDEKYLKKIGENIRRIRITKNIRQVHLADLCGFEKSNMRRLEAGKTNPTVKTLLNISRNLEVDLIDLLQ